MPQAVNKLALEERRRRVTELYLRGYTLRTISADVGVSLSQTHKDVQFVIAEWRKERLDDIDAYQTTELSRIAKLEQTYWEAWDRSVGESRRTVTESVTSSALVGGVEDPVQVGPKRNRAQITKEDENGDPRFLAGVQWCIDRRCKILGLDAPQDVNLTILGGLAAKLVGAIREYVPEEQQAEAAEAVREQLGC